MPADIIHPETGEQINDYLSPSRINSFIECPGEWALKYLYGMESPPATDKMTRGSLIEDYLNNHLQKSRMENPYYEDELDIHMRVLAKKLLKKMDDLLDKIPGGELIMQRQITNFNFKLPMVGFSDYQYGGNLFELKTTTRKPTIKPADNHLRQVMIYKGWHPNIENFELHNTCLIYGIIKKVPEVHFWVSPDIKEYFEYGEYSVISGEQVDGNSISMRLALPSIYHHMEFYKDKGFSLVPMDFGHYRLSRYNPRECVKFMNQKFEQRGLS